MPEASAILAVEGVRKHFGGVAAVDGASFVVRPRTVTALIGPNGAGKTSLFNVVSGFIRPDAGSIRFRGEEIAGRPAHRVAHRGLVRTFQLTRVLGKMTVLENMLLAAQRHPGERLVRVALWPRGIRARERAAREQARDLLDQVGLGRMADEYAATLSGGQRKLLELARALMAQPDMVLLDEPMAGVNPTLGHQLLRYLDRLRDERGMTVLFVEHDMDVVMGVSDEVVVMSEGRVITQGTPAEVSSDARVIDAYLGTEAG